MITADQLVLHAVGDYFLQSDWMAKHKTSRLFPAAVHALTYSLPFLLLQPSLNAMLVITSTHFVIDHWRLARYLVWIRNFLGTGNSPWAASSATGHGPEKPIWMAVWLMIIVDNTTHVVINALALRYL